MKKGSTFGVVPTSAVFDTRLTPAVFRVLCALATYADEERICRPGQKTIADRLEITRQAIGRSVEQLVKLGYLERVHRFRPDGGKASNEYRIIFDQEPPMQHDVASTTQPAHDIPMQHDVAYHATPGLHPHATSEVASRTDHKEQTISLLGESGNSSAEEGGAHAPVGADAALFPLCSELAQTTGLTVPAKSLLRLIHKHAGLGHENMLLEADKCVEWQRDPKRNKKKRQMSVALLDNWLSKAEQPLPPIVFPQSAVPSSPSAAPTRPDGRNLDFTARPRDITA